MTLQLTAEEYPEFSRLYAGFLGIWTQVKPPIKETNSYDLKFKQF